MRKNAIRELGDQPSKTEGIHVDCIFSPVSLGKSSSSFRGLRAAPSHSWRALKLKAMAVCFASMPDAFRAWSRRRVFSDAAVVFGILVTIAMLGCHRGELNTESASQAPNVSLTRPKKQEIVRTVGQPSFVQAYERASIYPKMSAYIKKWYVDIGDMVQKGQVIADLFVPEVEENYKTKAAAVELDQQQVKWAIEQVKVAKANVDVAAARLEIAKAMLDRYKAQVWRWDVQVKRLAREVKRTVVDPQVLLESQNQLKASIAAQIAAEADIAKAAADLESAKATYEEDKVAVDVAKAKVDVDTSDWNRVGAWVGYLKLYAPFEGIISARNANTGDFVLPLTGDPTADWRAPHLSPGNKAAPIFVVDRTDVVRVFVDIPERDTNYVKKGTPASVLVQAFRDEPIPAVVTRTSWALNFTTRTLRAEIDLVNSERPKPYWDSGSHEPGPGGGVQKNQVQILPGMYAYGYVTIMRPNVLAIPESAITHRGDKTYCWLYENGKSVRYEIETGISDGQWTEVIRRRAEGSIFWKQFDGSEEVILIRDPTLLMKHGPVRVVKAEADRIAAGE